MVDELNEAPTSTLAPAGEGPRDWAAMIARAAGVAVMESADDASPDDEGNFLTNLRKASLALSLRYLIVTILRPVSSFRFLLLTLAAMILADVPLILGGRG